MAYHAFKDEDGRAYGSFETFELTAATIAAEGLTDEEGDAREPGFYWWACFPGCMPDGDAVGPFTTEEEAIRDAQGDA